jgi:hypothetical protein
MNLWLAIHEDKRLHYGRYVLRHDEQSVRGMFRACLRPGLIAM